MKEVYITLKNHNDIHMTNHLLKTSRQEQKLRSFLKLEPCIIENFQLCVKDTSLPLNTSIMFVDQLTQNDNLAIGGLDLSPRFLKCICRKSK